MKNLIVLIALFFLNSLIASAQKTETLFKFAFLTDIHLNKSNDGECVQGLKQALNHAKASSPEFFLFGGDNMDIDGLQGKDQTADSLMKVFKTVLTESGVSYYPCIGNHDRFNGSTGSNMINSSKLFESHFGNSYYHFNHKGVEFFVLNSVIPGDKNSYFIYDEQKKWLENTLKQVDTLTPIIVALHVPMMSLYYPTVEGTVSGNDVIGNFKEIWDMFSHHRLQLVLQGHQHIYEQMYTKGTWFVTGGAVSAGWWSGPYHGTQEGYLLVTVDTQKNISWEYVDYGWDAKK